ncbi:dTDP-4-amino-4,6-dideoxygalactose transaminase [Aliiglaciecola sp. M165]|uniref:dTDP-4-amino-4,6-dideoxygalactose transaminase n=1 Tax=Aliiglaciecola sp. M165 TaxID=2593649 RepID=UPI001180D6B2|nr:dTDP-4-amino-4,6-dideoxygalactose transaminase [Aliiglaciecola sp. M165]TRY30773.1 dTDP-4-amino-4,6-dideoxygalactose transaminase [Aliiglaciecola sp. M165]
MIPFNKHCYTGRELEFIEEAISSSKISGDGLYSLKCQNWFEENLGAEKTLLTPSCTAALEMAALLLDLSEGDEVIMPSYTFVSTANAFSLRGAKIVFVDIRKDTMNIDETKIESAISTRTKAIVPVHYAGVACEMDTIMEIAEKYGLYVIEDAAQGMMASYKGRSLGTIGHMGTFSFHETKNYTSGGEGGLLIINDKKFSSRAEIIREKGTNRSQFFRGQIDKYTWTDIGSSYLPSDIQAAYLYAQLLEAAKINENRLETWGRYYNEFQELGSNEIIQLPHVPEECSHNAHMFYFKFRSLSERTEFISVMKQNGVSTVFHYVPLHSSPAGLKLGSFHGPDVNTTNESEKLIRLPLFYGMSNVDVNRVIELTKSFF